MRQEVHGAEAFSKYFCEFLGPLKLEACGISCEQKLLDQKNFAEL